MIERAPRMTSVALGAVFALALPFSAVADQHEQAGQQAAQQANQQAGQQAGQQAQQQQDQAQQQREGMDTVQWAKMREQTTTAEELMGADVSNGFNQVGNVRDLVLSEDGSTVEYVLYEIPYPYKLYAAQNGFVAFENLEVENTTGFGLKLRFDDAEAAKAPEQLTINRQEADNRMVSNILGASVSFEGQESRPVEDILIDRKTGKIKAYVVNQDPDAWFNNEPRLVSADSVQIDTEGKVSASTEFAALEPIRYE